MGTVREVTKQIEDQVKPTLANTSEHKGFCIALAAVNDAIGDVDAVLSDVPTLPTCPDCGTVMQKMKGTNNAGEDLIVWRCACVAKAEDTPAGEDTSTTDPEDDDL